MAESSGQQRRGRPFQPGVSGNPGGRPKDVGWVRKLAKKHTREAIETLVLLMRDTEQPGVVRKGAADSLLDRAFGKPTQPMSGEGGGPLAVAFSVDLTAGSK